MERIELGSLEHTTERIWITGKPGHWQYSEIRLGRLDGNRWFAARSGNRWDGAWAAYDERSCCDAITSWMRRRGGDWRELTPAERT